MQDVWGVKPLKIREGGTVPTIFWLENEFQRRAYTCPSARRAMRGIWRMRG